jgi:hypothetical protein
MSVLELDGRAAPGTFPIPTGRGRWRFTLHRRGFAPNTFDQTQLLELGLSARSRSLTRAWDAPAELRFTMNGRAADAAAIQELAHEVYAWRWDDQTGADVCTFRGIIDHSEDVISEQAHTVNFVAHDYLATLARRPILDATPVTYTTDQDTITAALLARAGGGPTNLIGYQPGSNLPIAVVLVGADGTTTRAVSGQIRARTYLGGTLIGTAIDQLAKVLAGFDYDVIPEPAAADTLTMIDHTGATGPLGAGRDALRIFYPAQGVARTDMVLQYGGNVAAVTRTVSSADYANTIRSLGNNGSSDPAVAQLISLQANTDASGVTTGWWPFADTGPSDVNQQATLDQRAQGLLANQGVLVPSYTLTMRPDGYAWGSPNMGDTVPLVIASGRLQVNTTVRVVGITWTIGDDGQEDVAVVVGRPLTSLGDLLARQTTAINALARR